MIAKRELKAISALKIKKFREEQKKLFVEGLRVLDEALQSPWKCDQLLMTRTFIERHGEQIEKKHFARIPQQIISDAEFKSLSDTQSPQGVGGVFHIPTFRNDLKNAGSILYFDNIGEPGNAGTLIRTAVWFGITHIILSAGSVDIYNPKLIRSAAGSFFHSRLFQDSSDHTLLKQLKGLDFQIYGADMHGTDFREIRFLDKSILALGNEANGLTADVKNLITQLITIPCTGKGESLNVAAAGSILLSRFPYKG
jgi:TrmH family RNA methyltransferase